MLNNKIALITGASRGIGAAIALEMAREGAFVVGTATTEAGAEKITQEIKGAGLSGKGVQFDVTDAAAIGKMMTYIQGLAGTEQGPHILVNNAGITRDN